MPKDYSPEEKTILLRILMVPNVYFTYHAGLCGFWQLKAETRAYPTNVLATLAWGFNRRLTALKKAQETLIEYGALQGQP